MVSLHGYSVSTSSQQPATSDLVLERSRSVSVALLLSFCLFTSQDSLFHDRSSGISVCVVCSALLPDSLLPISSRQSGSDAIDLQAIDALLPVKATPLHVSKGNLLLRGNVSCCNRLGTAFT